MVYDGLCTWLGKLDVLVVRLQVTAHPGKSVDVDSVDWIVVDYPDCDVELNAL